jgi:3-oxoacyl-[acyl-carrier protein] reductase
MRGLKDKRVVITGAAAGIGRATARRFLEEGARLLLCDRQPYEATGLAAELGSERVRYVAADVSTVEGQHAVERALNETGVDVLINNAGITRDASVLKMSGEDWDHVVAVNLTAVFRLCQIAAAPMKAQKSGVILNAASVVAHNGNFGQANYVASKAGVIGLTKTLARELGRANVRVNAVAPGFTSTDMVKRVPDTILAGIVERTPLGRLAEPDEIAAAYAFLASDDARFITGAVLDVDGGLVL